MIVVEEGERAVRRHQPVQQAQRRRAVHPVERTSHRDEPERPDIRRQVERARLTHIDRHARLGGRRTAGLDHVGLRVDRHDLEAQPGERHRQQAWAATQVHHRIARRQPGEVRDAGDERVGIGEPIARVIGHRGAEAARLENRRKRGSWRRALFSQSLQIVMACQGRLRQSYGACRVSPTCRAEAKRRRAGHRATPAHAFGYISSHPLNSWLHHPTSRFHENWSSQPSRWCYTPGAGPAWAERCARDIQGKAARSCAAARKPGRTSLRGRVRHGRRSNRGGAAKVLAVAAHAASVCGLSSDTGAGCVSVL